MTGIVSTVGSRTRFVSFWAGCFMATKSLGAKETGGRSGIHLPRAWLDGRVCSSRNSGWRLSSSTSYETAVVVTGVERTVSSLRRWFLTGVLMHSGDIVRLKDPVSRAHQVDCRSTPLSVSDGPEAHRRLKHGAALKWSDRYMVV
ncbi:hypothetical protein PM082_015395 [Marasmius tenuissimus]|nr:hypothetical protein PM082_015395 [Marasmius tenuissimus]